MHEQFINILGQILINNIGNKLTEELASGIVSNTNMALQKYGEMLEAEGANEDKGKAQS